MNQHKILHKRAQSIQDILAEKGVPCKVVELSESTRTAAEAAASIGCDVAQIAKSLIFKTAENNQPVLKNDCRLPVIEEPDLANSFNLIEPNEKEPDAAVQGIV